MTQCTRCGTMVNSGTQHICNQQQSFYLSPTSQYDELKAENARLQDKLKEIMAYLPKVPAHNHEKILTKEIFRLQTQLKIALTILRLFSGKDGYDNVNFALELIDSLENK